MGVAVAAAACGGGGEASESPRPRPAGLFAYDRSQPLGLRDRGIINRADYPIQVRDVSFPSPRGGRITAYLIVPPGEGPFPAVVYLHGAGQSRVELVAHGAWLAARRAVALSIDSPYARSPAPTIPEGIAGLRKERDLAAQTVVDLRRAVDVLQSLPQVDGDRIGFVGLSAGARSGAVLAGVERRIKAFVLMSGGADPPASFAARSPPQLRATITDILADTDPLRYVARAAPAELFFQNGLADEVVPRPALEALSRAGSQPKRVRWYRADHGLSTQAFREQLDWLGLKLGIAGPAVPGALTGP